MNTASFPAQRVEGATAENMPQLLLAVLVCGAVAFGVPWLLPERQWPNVPFHSALEAFGTIAALCLGGMLLMMRRHKKELAYGLWIACGLIGMGLLDGFHASVQPGVVFVWLHSTASLAGGLLFALVWLPDRAARSPVASALPATSVAGAILLGTLSIAFPEALPAMVRPEGFTAAAKGINLVAGALFLAAGANLLYRYQAAGGNEKPIFASLCLLFGAAGAVFPLSRIWEPDWWFWHLLRLAAYGVALGYVFVLYRRSLLGVGETAGVIATASAQIAATTEQYERIAAQQAAAVSETTATLEQLQASSRRLAEQAEAVVATATKALATTEEGVSLSERASGGMAQMKEKIGTVSEQILRLSEQAGQVGGIASLVGDIAGQTNMLALNAAVEAARAGESGRGFAVVAAEVRKLADQSKKSAERANALIADIQKATNAVVMAVGQGAKTAEGVTGIAQQARQGFTSLAGAVSGVHETARQAMLNARQQVAAHEQVAQAMSGVSAGAKEMAAGATQTRLSLRQLAETAERLKSVT